MASTPPLLDFDALLAPIPGDNPAGEPAPYDIREKLEELRKEEDPEAVPPGTEPKKADWKAVVRVATETLTETSKDLLTAARLTEGLVKQNGFAGLRDGLHLLRLLIEQCWDRLNPVVETPDDMDLRAGPFNWLDEPDRGARFPNSLRSVPLVVAADGSRYSWVDWKLSQDGKGTVTREDFDKAIHNTPVDFSAAVVAELNDSAADLTQLAQLLGEKMEGVAPGLTGLRQALEECRTLANQILKMKGGGEAGADGAAETPAGDGQAAPAAGGGSGRAPGSREDAYRQLAQAAALLQRLEPHSPIPYLVQRAVQLGAMPFPQLMQALIRDANVLAELNRELGISEGEAAPPAG